MKVFFLIVLLIIINSCSFDDKTGIWKNEQNKLVKKDIDIFKDFQNINFDKNKAFNQIIDPRKNLNFFLESKKSISNWKDQFFANNNVYPNILYDKNNSSTKGKKLSRSQLSKNILFSNNLLITSNLKGDLIVYSVTKKNFK